MARIEGWVVGLAGWILWPMAAWAQPAATPHELLIDFATTKGLIRPLHGVNAGPLCYRGTVDLTEFHKELAIPLTRLHDVPWVNAEAVDIHTVFPDFRNDPERPESYQFGPTDDYIAAIKNVPSEIVYRLGESIEHTTRKYHVHPPRDAVQWAAICRGIIRHYNQGWAGGFHHAIRYWEIWNEPDVRPGMWTGTDEEYFRLYTVTAKAIKQEFPEVQVGGPAAGGTGEFVADGSFKPTAFLTSFLGHCRQEQAPLDFFSWHRYTSQPWDLPRRARAIRRVLDESGFPHAESHLNEWNYLPNDDWAPLVRQGQGVSRERWYEQMGGPAGAAFAGCALTLLQDAPLDAANFYTGEIQGFGLFTFAGVPKSNFYAFKAFRQMLDTPMRVETQGEIPGRIAWLAGMDASRHKAAALVSCLSGSREEMVVRLQHPPWPGAIKFQTFAVDKSHHLEPVAEGTLEPSDLTLRVELRPPCVTLIQFRQD